MVLQSETGRFGRKAKQTKESCNNRSVSVTTPPGSVPTPTGKSENFHRQTGKYLNSFSSFYFYPSSFFCLPRHRTCDLLPSSFLLSRTPATNNRKTDAELHAHTSNPNQPTPSTDPTLVRNRDPLIQTHSLPI